MSPSGSAAPGYRRSDFRLGSLEAIYEHRFSANGRGEVLDFSGQGPALDVEEDRAEWHLHHRSPSDLVALATALLDSAEAEVIGEPRASISFSTW